MSIVRILFWLLAMGWILLVTYLVVRSLTLPIWPIEQSAEEQADRRTRSTVCLVSACVVFFVPIAAVTAPRLPI